MPSVGVRCQEAEGSLFFSSITQSEDRRARGPVAVTQLWTAVLPASCPLHLLASVLIHAREALSEQHVLISRGCRASLTPSHMYRAGMNTSSLAGLPWLHPQCLGRPVKAGRIEKLGVPWSEAALGPSLAGASLCPPVPRIPDFHSLALFDERQGEPQSGHSLGGPKPKRMKGQ